MSISSLIKKHGLKKLVRHFDNRYGLGKLETVLACNWFNPFATVWVNFRSFPFKQAIKLPLWVYGRPRFYNLSGGMLIKGKVSSGMVKFNITRPGGPSRMNVQSELCNLGDILFSGTSYIGCGTKIFVEVKAKLEIGDKVGITDMINIGCLQSIKIGDLCRVTHRCQLMDSNYHYVANFITNTVANHKKNIVIGRGCWIGNTTTISGGTNLPDYTIVASNSLVNAKINSVPEESMVAGTPAKLIGTGFRRIYNVDYIRTIQKHFKDNPEEKYSIPDSFSREECSEVR